MVPLLCSQLCSAAADGRVFEPFRSSQRTCPLCKKDPLEGRLEAMEAAAVAAMEGTAAAAAAAAVETAAAAVDVEAVAEIERALERMVATEVAGGGGEREQAAAAVGADEEAADGEEVRAGMQRAARGSGPSPDAPGP